MTTGALLGIREDAGFRQYIVDGVKTNITGAAKQEDCLADIWIAISLLDNETPSADALEREVWRQIVRRVRLLSFIAQGWTQEMMAMGSGLSRSGIKHRVKKYRVYVTKNRLPGPVCMGECKNV